MSAQGKPSLDSFKCRTTLTAGGKTYGYDRCVVAPGVSFKDNIEAYDAGAKMLVFGDGRLLGSVGGGAMESRVIDEAHHVLRTGRPKNSLEGTTGTSGAGERNWGPRA